MRHNVPTEEGQETAALYALGALSQHEARAFEIHLRQGCGICQRELNEFTGVVDALCASAAEVAPPNYLRDLLNARIEKEASLLSNGDPRDGQVYRFPEKTSPTRPRAAPRAPLSQLLPWAVAACLLIAFAYAFISWRLDRRPVQGVASEPILFTIPAAAIQIVARCRRWPISILTRGNRSLSCASNWQARTPVRES